MTVYFIYKHGPEIHPYLYALTDKKKLKNSFMKERKKSMFVVKEKTMERSDFLNICKTHSKYLLAERGFETNSPFRHLSSSTVIWLTTTDYEEMNVITKEDVVILELGKYTDDISRAFNTDLLKALDKLHYFEIYKFVNEVQCHHSYFVAGVDTFSASKYRIDMFGVFMYLYGSTIDREGLLKDEY